MAVQTDQNGIIADRNGENLVAADKAIVMMRQRLLKAARDLQKGIEPPEARRPQSYNVRAMDIVVPLEADWKREMLSAMALDKPWVAKAS